MFHLHARPKNRLESIHTSTPSLEAEKLKSVMYGLAIGDALGVPYEFQDLLGEDSPPLVGGEESPF